MRPATRAVHVGRPPHEPDQPFNTPITMASTYVAGGDLEYGRYDNPTWRAFEDALGDLEGGRCLAFASGLAAVATILDLVGNGEKVVAPRHAYNGSVMQLSDLEARGRVKAHLVDISDTDAVVAACDDASLVWIESPTNPAMEIADIPAITKAAHDAGAYVVVDNTFATPLLQQPLDLGRRPGRALGDEVHRRPLRPADGRDRHPRRRALLGAQGPPRPRRRDPGSLRGLARPARPADPAAAVERAQANAQELVRRLRERADVTEVRYPGFGAMIAIVLPTGEIADLVQHSTKLWVYATSLGGVESTLERRRRWKTEAATIPEGLIRLSVGIEDVEDIWEDLAAALDAPL